MSIPVYSNPCLAPSKTGSAVFLIGVSDTIANRLEVNTINLANVNIPTYAITSSQVHAFWDSAYPKICTDYPGDPANNNSPIHVQQFNPFRSYDANVFPNGIIETPSNFNGVAFNSPKNFATVGNAEPISFVVASTNVTSTITGAIWSGIRVNGTDGFQSNRNTGIQTYPTNAPLVSVGTFTASSLLPANGNLIVFDSIGGGMAYPATGLDKNVNPNITTTVTLGLPTTVTMNAIKLTSKAIPITMGPVAYILDQAIDGSSVLYTINPGTTSTLTAVSVTGDVPSLSANVAATSSSTQIIIYVVTGGVPRFNIFDTATSTWSGPGLVKPYAVTTSRGSSTSTGSGSLPSKSNGSGGDNDSSSIPIGALVGGVVGVLVVIALIAFLFVRNRRKGYNQPPVSPPTDAYQEPYKPAGPSAQESYALQQQQHLAQQQQQQQLAQQQQQQQFAQQQYAQQQQQLLAQQQQQQYAQQQQYQQQQAAFAQQQQSPYTPIQHQQPFIHQHQVSYSPPVPPKPSPAISDVYAQKQGYIYTPPTVIPQQQPASPNIFQAQGDTASSPTSTQATYVPSSAAATPYVAAIAVPTSTPVTPPRNPQMP
ncbi:hypothetical protein BGX33_001169 [Mortierella sp. NVP41]|nr:hypothetical protein BGX33_001169 [Mortierella sp. NVP41]